MVKISAVAENWNIVWQTNLDATGTIPYSRVFSPTILSSPVVALSVTTTADYWKNQAIGYANQQIESGLLGNGLARVNSKRIIISGELSIIHFPFTVDYRLSIDLFSKVATTVAVSVYEYTGIIT
ncbi:MULTISPECIES: hypothetical protein [unclassified Microcoleus]|uniref:hypothetical protein n=1 Tax=unclassified Microcoleus TaxID=2642155 RepID=UPI001DB9A13E|nr:MULTISPECIES: hypothetical protein [unclassified Microcoleus]TAF91325.1 MAG: hypothetical protein EAZ49_06170 [Oscillatoriales cyanobacterium]MCC3439402.1 hypothetical protein [Microcoleus sp. PH2017_05_CCC_O_A]MCC3447459.1 hypothetical protein [Microcoleus sp. PH2017_09_SFU_O_A]MCC3588660.1 hypothetical protein [Microcoleus sp. PH2017_30_WIL_O_A]MCC3628467.1 hypothetical protein [Microcoleus sp. PH2017_39_LGB_O_B]